MNLPPNPLPVDELPALTDGQVDRIIGALIEVDQTPIATKRTRGHRRLIWAGVAATAAMLVVSVLGPRSVAPTAAAWTPVPSPLGSDRAAEVISQCQDQLATVGSTKVAIAEQRGRSAAVVLENDSLCIGFADDGPAGGGMAGAWQDVPLLHPIGDAVNVIYSGMAGGVTQPTTPGDDRTQHWVAVIVAVQAEVGPAITHAEVTLTDGEVVTATVSNGWLLAWWPKGIAPVWLITHSTHGTRYTPVTANPADWAPPTG